VAVVYFLCVDGVGAVDVAEVGMSERDCDHCHDEAADFAPSFDPWGHGDWLCHGCKVLRDNYEPDVSFERALAQKEGRGW
jgi:hypothetical protein